MNFAKEFVLKMISGILPDVRDTYKFQRKIQKLGKKSMLRPIWKCRDEWVKARDGHDILIRIFESGNKKLRPELIIYIHGGGWVVGDVDSYNEVCSTLAHMTGCKVISVDYRLAPENKFPIGLHDCYDTISHFMNGGMAGICADDIIVMGDSAGGNLTAVTALMARDLNEKIPRRNILLYPSTYSDHSEKSPYPSVIENGEDYVLTGDRIEGYMNMYQRDEKDRDSPYFAPLLADSFEGLPATLVITAEFDPLRDEGEDYGMRLMSAGGYVEIYRIPGALHGFISKPIFNSSVRRAYKYIKRFIEKTA